jgi:cbb3-type cytochrome oxidase maturation protein
MQAVSYDSLCGKEINVEIMLLLVPISIVLIAIAGGAFIWAVNRRQFENLDEHALDVLDDDN